MLLRKWTLCILVFIMAAVGCTHRKNQETAIPPSATLQATQTNLHTITEACTPTPSINWYSNPSSNPEMLGRNYGLLNSNKQPIYDTLEDAVHLKEKHWLAPEPPAYLAFDLIQTVDGKEYVHLTDGGWMPQEKLTSVTPTSFSGVILSNIPTLPFGWVIQDTSGWINSLGNESSGMAYNRYEEVLVLDEDNGYARLENGDWLPISDLALIDLDMLIDDAPASCRWVDVDLSSQTLVVFENCRPAFATLISSARAPAETPLGTFSIFYKEESLPLFANGKIASSESFYLADVPWLMFYEKNWAIHGAYWHDRFGEPWSHGCINVSPYDAHWLYQWSKLGDMIIVHE